MTKTQKFVASMFTALPLALGGYLMFKATGPGQSSLTSLATQYPVAMWFSLWATLFAAGFAWMMSCRWETGPMVWAVVLSTVAGVATWHGTGPDLSPDLRRLACFVAACTIPAAITSLVVVFQIVTWLYKQRWNQPGLAGCRTPASALRLALALLLVGAYTAATVLVAKSKAGGTWETVLTSDHLWPLIGKIGGSLIVLLFACYAIKQWRLTSLACGLLAAIGLLMIATTHWGLSAEALAMGKSWTVPTMLLLAAAPVALGQLLKSLGHAGGSGGSVSSGGSGYSSRSSSSWDSTSSSNSLGSYSSPSSSWDSGSSSGSNPSSTNYNASSSTCSPSHSERAAYDAYQSAGGGSQQLQQQQQRDQGY